VLPLGEVKQAPVDSVLTVCLTKRDNPTLDLVELFLMFKEAIQPSTKQSSNSMNGFGWCSMRTRPHSPSTIGSRPRSTGTSIEGIGQRSEAEVRGLLLRFLISSGNLGIDTFHLEQFQRAAAAAQEQMLEVQHTRRLVHRRRGNRRSAVGRYYLDLRSLFRVSKARPALSAYMMAHAQFLPGYEEIPTALHACGPTAMRTACHAESSALR
jgi:hypothetical protein